MELVRIKSISNLGYPLQSLHIGGETLVDTIRRLAAEKNLTIKELESRASVQRIDRWDKHVPSIDKVLSVASVLEVSVEDLIAG